MKNLLFILMLNVALISSISLYNSSSYKSQQNTSNPKTWQEQLEYAKKGKGSLTLHSYTYLGKVKSKTEIPKIVDEIFSDKYFICLGNSGDHHQIISLKNVNTKVISNEDHIYIVKQNLKDNIQVGFDILELEWEYKGEKYKSMAIASNDFGGVLYETIGHYSITTHSIETHTIETHSHITQY